MKAASLKQLKSELAFLPKEQLVDLCTRLAKYKVENKELLSYLLFEATNETEYANQVKTEIDAQFKEINKTNGYQAKKSIRKILRMVNKHIKYSGQKQTEVELRLHFCKKLKRQGIPMPINSTLGNLYLRQYQLLNKAFKTLHEDLQFDYEEEIKLL
jgi:hypothetical protein